MRVAFSIALLFASADSAIAQDYLMRMICQEVYNQERGGGAFVIEQLPGSSTSGKNLSEFTSADVLPSPAILKYFKDKIYDPNDSYENIIRNLGEETYNVLGIVGRDSATVYFEGGEISSIDVNMYSPRGARLHRGNGLEVLICEPPGTFISK